MGKNYKRDPIFADYFNDEFTTRRLGGELSTVESGSFDEGKLYLDGKTTNLDSNIPIIHAGSNVSFRIRCKINNITPASTSYFLDFRKDGSGNTHFLSWSASAISSALGFTSNKYYINGIETASLTGLEGEWIDVAFTGVNTYDITKASVGRFNGLTLNSAIDFDFIEIYEGTLTAEEVKNINNNSRYVIPNFDNIIIEYDSTKGVVKNKLSNAVVGFNQTPNNLSVWSERGTVSEKTDDSFTATVGGVDFTTTVGKKYRIKFDYTTTSTGLALWQGNVVTLLQSLPNPSGSVDLEFTATQTYIYLRQGNAGTTTVSNMSIYEIVPELTLTNIDVVKDGDIYSAEFNGADSKIDCGNFNDLTGDITVLSWIKPYSFGENSQGHILRNGKLIIRINDTNDNLEVSSDAATVVGSLTNSVKPGKYYFIAATRTSTGITNIYIDGVLSGSANQNSGTPAAGTTNITIGNEFFQSRTFDGLIPRGIIVNGIMSAEQISQYYTATKHLYNK